MPDNDVTIEPLTEGISKALFNMCIEKYAPSVMLTRDATNEDSDFRRMSHAADGFLRGLTPELVDVQEWPSPFCGCTLVFRACYGSDEYQLTYSIGGKRILDAVQYALLNHR